MRAALALAATLVALPAGAHVAPVVPILPDTLGLSTTPPVTEFRIRSGADEMARPQLGAYVGAAEENATAFRGPYGFGQCPAGTLLTTFGTCADERGR
ncbi:hypothetical protein [Jannaschia sp. W003]|uniref:hypothetical protein n=1 Tax=Jannaschia sp. W003 TaxID=2867012 RepID=UPI0021A4DCCE|nr:hypothetical protein [Jannaschia sp. W003]UWQ22795.1 hypothetical protein K3554_07170 [Jannaschia sp. W003]